MANLGQLAGADLAEPSDNLDPVPAGTYDVEMIESDVVQSKSGRGLLLKCTLKVIAGEHENRRIWTQFNIQHENETAQQIGQRQLSDLCRAVGFGAVPSESVDFHGLPFRVNVVVKTDPNYGARNEVKKYMPVGDVAATYAPQQRQSPAAVQPRSATVAKPAPAATGKAPPPWKQRAG